MDLNRVLTVFDAVFSAGHYIAGVGFVGIGIWTLVKL